MAGVRPRIAPDRHENAAAEQPAAAAREHDYETKKPLKFP